MLAYNTEKNQMELEYMGLFLFSYKKLTDLSNMTDVSLVSV